MTLYYRLPESAIAPFLTDLAARVKAEGIKVGSYPAFQKGVTISLIGQDVDAVRKYGQEVCFAFTKLGCLSSLFLLNAHLFLHGCGHQVIKEFNGTEVELGADDE